MWKWLNSKLSLLWIVLKGMCIVRTIDCVFFFFLDYKLLYIQYGVIWSINCCTYLIDPLICNAPHIFIFLSLHGYIRQDWPIMMPCTFKQFYEFSILYKMMHAQDKNRILLELSLIIMINLWKMFSECYERETLVNSNISRTS